jgi:putative flavoprotein involved in K+ transport
MDLTKENIRTIVWATGFRPDFSYVDVPVLDRKGRMRHDGGIVDAPGMYLMGMQFLRRRKSALIDGAGADARDLSTHLAAYLDQQSAARPVRAKGFRPAEPTRTNITLRPAYASTLTTL